MKPAFSLLAFAVAATPVAVRAESVLVFAASSLHEALQEIAVGWEAETGHDVALSLAGSSALARQIQAGAPADVFVSANVTWADALEADGLVRQGTRRDLLTNDLVLIAYDPEASPISFDGIGDLAALLGGGRLAMALTEAVPAGIYGRAALESLGWWEGIAHQVAETDNVRTALALVAAGEAPAGIVYATDALAEPRAHVLGTFPPDSHPPIRYPAFVPVDSGSAQAEAFLEYLSGEVAAEIFRSHGFGLAEPEG